MERKSQNALIMHLEPTLHLDFSLYNTFTNILASFNNSLPSLEDEIILRKNSLCVCAKSLQSCMTFCNPMDVAGQASLSMGFSTQEHWSGLLWPPPGDLPNPGIEPHTSHVSCIGRRVLYYQCHLESPLKNTPSCNEMLQLWFAHTHPQSLCWGREV